MRRGPLQPTSCLTNLMKGRRERHAGPPLVSKVMCAGGLLKLKRALVARAG